MFSDVYRRQEVWRTPVGDGIFVAVWARLLRRFGTRWSSSSRMLVNVLIKVGSVADFRGEMTHRLRNLRISRAQAASEISARMFASSSWASLDFLSDIPWRFDLSLLFLPRHLLLTSTLLFHRPLLSHCEYPQTSDQTELRSKHSCFTIPPSSTTQNMTSQFN